MFSGRPLSLHEGRLPQLSREMMQSHDWLMPRSGGRVWPERPPLPQWIAISVSAIFHQHCDRVWVVRLPAALAGTLIVLLVVSVTSSWFGRWIGICSGLVLATSYEFYSYSSLAEDDIFLAALVMVAMALIMRIEFPAQPVPQRKLSPLGTRPWAVVCLFIVLGLVNLAKGPLVGASVILSVLGSFLLLSRDLSRARPYLWLWGWLIAAAIGLAWPLFVVRRYPDVLQLWRFDYAGATRWNQPIWYYPVQLLGAMAPWTLFALLGLWLTRNQAWRIRNSPTRFLWCWALVPIIVLSIPSRKHHHYLVPSLAPWAILAALGLRYTAQWLFQLRRKPLHPAMAFLMVGLPGAATLLLLHARIPGPVWAIILLAAMWVACVTIIYLGFWRKQAPLIMGALVGGIVVVCCWGQSCLPDQNDQDTLFLQRTDALVPPNSELFINGDLDGELDFFRICFYLRPQALLLHNLSYLRDDRIKASEVYVVARAAHAGRIAQLGECQIILQSGRARRERSPDERFTLFRLRFRPDLARNRAPDPTTISPLQAYGRADGPFCGGPL